MLLYCCCWFCMFFFFKQKTAYEMRISDWSSDVCSSDLAAKRWSIIIRPGQAIPTGHIELGELCRVHRGQVTGDNSIWIAGDHAKELPASVLTPTVTKARDLLRAGDVLENEMDLRRVINLDRKSTRLNSSH